MSVPVASVAQIQEVQPSFMRATTDPAPVRDGINAALVAIFQEYQRRSAYAAAQSDPLQATGTYLKGLAEDHDIFATPGETEAAVRARIFQAPNLVTPTAIIAAVTAIVSPYSAVQPQIFDSDLDCYFIEDGTAPWACFVGNNPTYSDRLYADDLATNGVFRPQSRPGQIWAFSDCNGRNFVVAIPVLDAADSAFSWALAGPDATADDGEMYISDGTDASGSESNGTDISFIYTGSSTANDLYQAVVSVIQRMKPQGFRFEVLVDPLLK